MTPRAQAPRGRRAHGGPYSTTASEAPCQACRRPLLYAWDEGLRVRVDTLALDEAVAAALRDAGRVVYVLTQGLNLVRETAERAGSLRLVRSRHAEHICRKAPKLAPVVHENLELFDLESVRPPAHRREGDR